MAFTENRYKFVCHLNDFDEIEEKLAVVLDAFNGKITPIKFHEEVFGKIKLSDGLINWRALLFF